jgi:hypothetical protein
MIARNTNRYAEIKGAASDGKRTWWPTSAAEIKVFVAIFIYMSVVRLPAYEDYWSPKYGEFRCAQHMSLNRFEDLKRYMHISNPILNGNLLNHHPKFSKLPNHHPNLYIFTEPPP